MNIVHVLFAKTGTGLSGGEVAMLEFVRRFDRMNYQNVILTTDNGKKVYQEYGLKENNNIRYCVINSYSTELRFHIFISYLIRLFQINKLFKHINFNTNSIVICHSDFFPNSIATAMLRKRIANGKYFYWFHSKAPRIFRGYLGEFLNKFHFPSIREVHHFLNQHLFFKLIRKDDYILSPNPYYESFLRKKSPNANIYTFNFYGGCDVYRNSELLTKKYDVVWMGRFQSLKGLDFFIKIIAELKKIRKIKVLIIGGGTDNQVKKYRTMISEYGLNSIVDYQGFIKSKKRFEYLQSSKIFCMTSIYENFGTVILESLKCGVPVVAFDLPTFSIYNKGVIKVPMFNIGQYVKELNNLLSFDHYTQYIKDCYSFSEQFSWDKTINEFINLTK